MFFEHKEFEYYPCHSTIEEINCLFCFCPLYFLADCPGLPRYLDNKAKDCSICTFPHDKNKYDLIMAYLSLGVTPKG
jgi:Zn-finger protein